jgi:hypothetical protein
MKKTVHITMLTAVIGLAVFTPNTSLLAATISSLNSGNWSATSTWQGGIVPSSTDNVIIQSTVTLDISPTVASLDVPTAGIFGTNDLTITGDLTISSGRISNAGNVSVGGNFNWTAGQFGYFINAIPTNITVSGLTNITTSGQKFLENAKLILNGGGNWMGGSIALNSVSTLDIPVSKTLVVNNPTVTLIFSATGSGNSLDLKGILRKQGSNQVVITPINNTGDVQIEAGTLSLNGYSGGGSMTIATNATLQTSGLNYLNATLTNNGMVTSQFTFAGTTQQTLAGTGDFVNMTVNNAQDLAITGTQTLSGQLIFTNGKIQLGNTDFTIGFATNANANRYIRTNGTGNLKQSVGSSPTLTIFPVGESNYTPVSITQNSGSNVYAVRVSDGIDIAHPLLGTQYIGQEWDISRATVSSTPATIKMEWNTSDVGVGYNSTLAQMLHYNSSITNWESLPIGNRSASTANSLTQTGVTSFSPFSVGVPASVLSAELIDFKAITHKSTVDLSWQTASEKDMSHFDIEQSTDGLTFSKMGETKAAGKANAYIFNVEGPLSIKTYFRLKIVNSDGSFTYSKVLSVAFGKELTVKAFPNPIQNELTIDVMSASKQLEIEVIDVLGRSIYQKNESNTEGSKLLTINTLEWLSGIYFLKISDGKKVFQQKIVKR